MSGSAYKLKCPHCQQGIRVRNSFSMHPLLRQAYLQCTNLNCGATFRGQFEITHEMSPPTLRNPGVDLPVADQAMRRGAIERPNQQQMHIDDVLV